MRWRFWIEKPLVGLTRDQLVTKLNYIDQLFPSGAYWLKDGKHSGDGIDYGKPESFGTRRWTLQGAIWTATQEPFLYKQICMAFRATMEQPNMFLQNYEELLDFPMLKDWLTATIEYAKNNDPWHPYVSDIYFL